MSLVVKINKYAARPSHFLNNKHLILLINWYLFIYLFIIILCVENINKNTSLKIDTHF